MGRIATYILLLAAVLLHVNCVKEEFVKDGIVPDVVDEAPQISMDITYPKKGNKVTLGNVLTPKETQDIPEISWEAGTNALYTLAMVDPDAPSRAEHTLREWEHWLVVNIPGNRISNGETFAEYVGPAPPKGTGLHRYLFLVYLQANRISPTEAVLSSKNFNRSKFSIKDFASKYNLGKPIAGNYFLAQNE